MNIPEKSMPSLSIITLVASILVSFPLVSGDSDVTERDILVYLQHVGRHARLDPDKDPVFYANEIPHEWNLNDKRVQQLVGPICGRLMRGSEHYDDMMYTCSIFEMLGVHFLHAVWQAVINTMEHIPHEKQGIWKITRKTTGQRIRHLVQFDTRYSEHLPKLCLAHVREMLPTVCAKLETGMMILPVEKSLAIDGCEFVEELAVGFLKGIVGRKGYSRGKVEVENQVRSEVSFNDVKTMLPTVCEENEDLRHSPWCVAFFSGAYTVLSGIEQKLPLPDLKPFIFHICNKEETKENDNLNKQCNNLFTNSLEKFVSK